MALTSFLTGVTEPIEFTFMFLAPALYALHAVLTGLAMVMMDLLGCHLGFGFSAGLFDYVLNFGKATHPLYLVAGGRGLLRASTTSLSAARIVRFDLATPGARAEEVAAAAAADAGDCGARRASSRRWAARQNLARSRRARRGCGSCSPIAPRVDARSALARWARAA